MLRWTRAKAEDAGGFVAYEHKDKPVKVRPLPVIGFIALIIGIIALGSIMVSSRASRELSPNRPARSVFSGFTRRSGIRIPGATALPVSVDQRSAAGVTEGGQVTAILANYKKFEVVPSPKPVPKPSVVPVYYHTRGCTCKENWQEIVAKYPAPADMPHGGKKWSPEEAAAAAAIPGESVCTCEGVACLPAVTPAFLTEAAGQDVCSLKRHTGYGCTARCTPEGEVRGAGAWEGRCASVDSCACAYSRPPLPPLPQVHWNGFACLRGDGVAPSDKNVNAAHLKPCDPLVVTPTPTPTGSPSTRPAVAWSKPVLDWDPQEVRGGRLCWTGTALGASWAVRSGCPCVAGGAVCP